MHDDKPDESIPPPNAPSDAESPSDIDLAVRWAKCVADRFAYMEGNQWWQCEDAKIWTYSETSAALAHLQSWLKLLVMQGEPIKITATRLRDVLFIAKSELGPTRLSIFDTNRHWIAADNGVIDLPNKTLIEHSPWNRITKKLPYEFDQKATCPVWKKCLNEILVEADGYTPCQEWIDIMQLWFGYCLSSDTSLQVAMFWLGSGGNGKGTVTRLITKLIGDHNVVPVSIANLHEEYHRAYLYGKLVGIVDEPDMRDLIKNGTWLKRITGEGPIDARRPTQEVFNYKSTLRLIITCNDLPHTRDLSEGFFRRQIIMKFRRQFEPHEIDTHLDEKLEAELPGILNWALVGLRKLRAAPDLLKASKQSDSLKAEYRSEQDSIGRFLDDHYERGTSSNDKIRADELYRTYKKWCQDSGEYSHPAITVGKRMTTKGYKTMPYRVVIDGLETRARFWLPIRSKALLDPEAVIVSGENTLDLTTD